MQRTICSCLLLILSLAASAHAQTRLSEEGAGRLRAQADECAAAFVAGDYERMAGYTHPRLIEILGGRAKMVAFLRRGVAEMKAEGFEPVSYTADAPTQVLRVGRQIYAVVPAKLRMRAPGGVLVGESFMIGVSADEGKNWKFVNGDVAAPDKLKVLFPAAAGRLKLPAPKPPVLEPAP